VSKHWLSGKSLTGLTISSSTTGLICEGCCSHYTGSPMPGASTLAVLCQVPLHWLPTTGASALAVPHQVPLHRLSHVRCLYTGCLAVPRQVPLQWLSHARCLYTGCPTPGASTLAVPRQVPLHRLSHTSGASTLAVWLSHARCLYSGCPMPGAFTLAVPHQVPLHWLSHARCLYTGCPTPGASTLAVPRQVPLRWLSHTDTWHCCYSNDILRHKPTLWLHSDKHKEMPTTKPVRQKSNSRALQLFQKGISIGANYVQLLLQTVLTGSGGMQLVNNSVKITLQWHKQHDYD